MNQNRYDIDAIKRDIRILEVASVLGIKVRANKAFCFGGHDKKSPSLNFTPLKNLWNCFGCGKGGSNIDLVMQARGLEFKDAVNWLATTFGLWLADGKHWKENYSRYRQAQHKVSAPPQNSVPNQDYLPDPEVYEWFLSRCSTSQTALKYLQSRGFTLHTIKKFQIKDLLHPKMALQKGINRWGIERLIRCGLAKKMEANSRATYRCRLAWWDYTILFPFVEGKMITYIQGRRLASEGPKYVNLVGVHKTIFNRNALSGLRAGSTVHICEGIPDALAADQQGWNAVGILGATSFNSDWVNLFMDFKVVVVPDMDAAGTQFAIKIQQLFKRRGKIVQSAILPRGKDLCEFLNQKALRMA